MAPGRRAADMIFEAYESQCAEEDEVDHYPAYYPYTDDVSVPNPLPLYDFIKPTVPVDRKPTYDCIVCDNATYLVTAKEHTAPLYDFWIACMVQWDILRILYLPRLSENTKEHIQALSIIFMVYGSVTAMFYCATR